MSKISTDTFNLTLEETDFEILLRERLLKFLVTKERKNINWDKEDMGFQDEYSTYDIENNAYDIKFRYKLGYGYSTNCGLVFRLCNVSFTEQNRRKGILTGMMKIVESFADRYGIKYIQVECPHTEAILSWLKKNNFREVHRDLYEKEIK